MNNYDAFKVAFEGVFDFFSQHWAIILFPFVMSMSVSLFKSLCQCGRRRPLPTPSAAPRSGPAPASLPRSASAVAPASLPRSASAVAPAPAPSASAPVRCEGCSDCPFFADTGKRDESCPLHGTSSCGVGLYVLGGKFI